MYLYVNITDYKGGEISEVSVEKELVDAIDSLLERCCWGLEDANCKTKEDCANYIVSEYYNYDDNIYAGCDEPTFEVYHIGKESCAMRSVTVGEVKEACRAYIDEAWEDIKKDLGIS